MSVFRDHGARFPYRPRIRMMLTRLFDIYDETLETMNRPDSSKVEVELLMEKSNKVYTIMKRSMDRLLLQSQGRIMSFKKGDWDRHCRNEKFNQRITNRHSEYFSELFIDNDGSVLNSLN